MVWVWNITAGSLYRLRKLHPDINIVTRDAQYINTCPCRLPLLHSVVGDVTFFIEGSWWPSKTVLSEDDLQILQEYLELRISSLKTAQGATAWNMVGLLLPQGQGANENQGGLSLGSIRCFSWGRRCQTACWQAKWKHWGIYSGKAIGWSYPQFFPAGSQSP